MTGAASPCSLPFMEPGTVTSTSRKEYALVFSSTTLKDALTLVSTMGW